MIIILTAVHIPIGRVGQKIVCRKRFINAYGEEGDLILGTIRVSLSMSDVCMGHDESDDKSSCRLHLLLSFLFFSSLFFLFWMLMQQGLSL